MDLTFSERHEAFRAEAREWLRANVPTGLGSMNTAEGFAAHREWERKLFDNRWAANPSAVFMDPSPDGTLARSHSRASARKASCCSEKVRSMAARA